MTPLETLTVATIQSITRSGLISYLEETGTSPAKALQDLMKDAKQQLRSLQGEQRQAAERLMKRSIAIMKTALSEEQHSLLNTTHAVFNAFLDDALGKTVAEKLITTLENDEPKISEALFHEPSSHLEALCQFMYDFEDNFNIYPDPLKGAEIDDLILISERVWDSANVQELSSEKQYEKYAELMSEDMIGSHILIEEDTDDKSLFNTLEKKIGSALKHRYSSHYVSKVKRVEMHRGFDGNLFPTTLIYQGSVGIKDGKVVTHNNGAAYWRNLPAGKKQRAKEMKMTWRQREAHDMSRIPSAIMHCLIDFPHYLWRKSYWSPDRPNIARHTMIDSSKRRLYGRPDTDPVILRLYRHRIFDIHFFDLHHVPLPH